MREGGRGGDEVRVGGGDGWGYKHGNMLELKGATVGATQ